jgi:Ser/Thr protein kinase RdoA (MazF antagonist)
VDDDLIAFARAAYGWPADVAVSTGPRGALGQIWRVDVGPARYALKEIFAEPASEALIETELAFGRRATAAGVRLPASHPGRDGRHLLTAPDGRWLRLYDWVDLRPVDLAAGTTPGRVGSLLARLHRCGPATTTEADGDPPHRWYHGVPGAHEWLEVADAAATAGVAWAAPLADRLATVPDLTEAIGPADPAELILCHRDLHPENVLDAVDAADPDRDGEFVVVDWDNLGPAAPARELARVLFDWFCPGPTIDLDAMGAAYTAYLAEGGPGRITRPADFTTLIATRLNFLLVQARVALDPKVKPRNREWAVREIDETLRLGPTPAQLADALTLTARLGSGGGRVR